MSAAIAPFGQTLNPRTDYSQSLALGGNQPAGGPQPPPATVQAAITDSRIQTDTFTPSQAANELVASISAQAPPTVSPAGQTESDDSSPIKQFQSSQAPPPYTLKTVERSATKESAKPLATHPFSSFQIRQFSDLIKTIRSITSAVLPNLSFSA